METIECKVPCKIVQDLKIVIQMKSDEDEAFNWHWPHNFNHDHNLEQNTWTVVSMV